MSKSCGDHGPADTNANALDLKSNQYAYRMKSVYYAPGDQPPSLSEFISKAPRTVEIDA